jgi:hypothetical protein
LKTPINIVNALPGLRLLFLVSQVPYSVDGGCHMFSGNRRFPALAADAVGQVWEKYGRERLGAGTGEQL